MALSTSGSVFAHHAFRLVWGAGAVIYLAAWMANVAAAWLMTQFNATPFMVALIQTATTLPYLLLSLPSGVLADLVDRRRLMLWTQTGSLAASAALCLLTWSGLLGPWGLVALTFVLGAMLAIHNPAAQATVAEVVPRAQMPHAIALGSISFNLARSVGPGIAGVLLSFSGADMLYAMTCGAFAMATVALSRLPSSSKVDRRTLPPERLVSALQTGLRYARHSPALRAVIVRSSVYTLSGSALWALLPLVAKDNLGGSAAGYGALIACLGGGAILGGLLLEPLRHRFALDDVVAGASVVFAVTTLIVALLRWPPLVYGTLIIGGAGWMVGNTMLFTLAQTNVPSWVRARASALLLVIFQGTMAIGAMWWGFIASHASVSTALIAAALAALPLQVLNARHRLKLGSDADVTVAQSWNDGASAAPVVEDEGQVAVEICYAVASENQAEFIEHVRLLGRARRRNGALFWRLYREVEDQDVFVERMLVDSWADYQRQQSRHTLADLELLERLKRLQKPGVPVRTRHSVSLG